MADAEYQRAYEKLRKWATRDRTPEQAVAYLRRRSKAETDFRHDCSPYGYGLIDGLGFSYRDAARILFVDVKAELEREIE